MGVLALKRVIRTGMRNDSRKAQSAMEYLTTYGWAIIVIVVVLAVMYSLGLFNSSTYAARAAPGSCQVVRPEGPGSVDFMSITGTCNNELPEYAAAFNGASYVSTNAVIDAPSFTITAWANKKSNSLNNGRNGIAGEGWNYGDRYLGVPNDADWGGWCYNTSTQTGWTAYGNAVVPGIWTFVALSYNMSNHTLDFWEGNSSNLLIKSQLTGVYCTPDNPSTDNIPFYIGTTNGGEYWNGYISNVQVYNKSLSAADLYTLYHEGIGGKPVNLVNLTAWWPLDDNAHDYSGDNLNGTAVGVSYTSAWDRGYIPPVS